MFQDRIKELRRIPAKDLLPHPKNWRTHPITQQKALKGILSEIGYADALLARELPNGQLQLIDGHLRAKTSPNQDVPVLVVDLNETEADKLLAVFDPITSMAQTNQELLDDLLANVETQNDAVAKLLNSLSSLTAIDDIDLHIPKVFQIVITCRSEKEQQTLYESLYDDGVDCRIVNL